MEEKKIILRFAIKEKLLLSVIFPEDKKNVSEIRM